MQDIRCKSCGRLLAKHSDGVLCIKASKHGENILVESGKVHFVCPSFVWTEGGKVQCNETTRVSVESGLVSAY